MPGIVHKTKGFITARDLINNYHDQYEARVVNREVMVQLRQALRETNNVWYEATAEHKARSDKTFIAGQNCSPTTGTEVNMPVAWKAPATTKGFSCTQNNYAFNKMG